LASPVASRIATDVIDAESAAALCRGRAGGSNGELTSTRAIALIRRAFIVRIGVGRNRTARSVRRARLRHAARLACSRACRIAAEIIDAVIAGALRRHGTRRTIAGFACSGAIALAESAFIVGIIVRANERTRAIDAAGLCRTACLTRARASGIAANVIDAEATATLRIGRACRSIHELTCARTVAFVHRAFIVRVGVRRDRTACAVRCARLGIAACLARTTAGRIAAEPVNAAIADALRRHHTRRTIGRFARTGAVAFAASTFVVGVIVRRNERARTIHAAGLGRAARLTRSHTSRAAADIVHAEAAQAFRGERAHIAVGFLAVTRDIANRAGAAKVLLPCIIGRANTGNLVARLARSIARRIATNAVDTLAALALCRAYASRAIGCFASASAIAFRRAFIVGIGICHDVAARTVNATSLGRRARPTRARARVFATHAVDAEVAGALRIPGAHGTIREFRATSYAVAYRRANAFIVGIGIARDGTASTIRLSRLRIAACSARTETRVFAADEIDTGLAEAFVICRARLAVRIDALASAVAYLKAETCRRIVRLLRRNVRTCTNATSNCAGLAFTGATAVATHAVDAEAERAFIVPHAQRALGELRRADVHEQVAVIAACALRVTRTSAEALTRIARECAAGRGTTIEANARTVAGIGVHERITSACSTLTNGSVRVESARAGTIARTRLAARASRFLIAFVLRILTSHDSSALAIDAAALERRRAGLAETRANAIATDAVDAETARALVCRGASRADRDLALSEAVTRAGIALIRGIRIRRNVDARADVVLHVARLARSDAVLIATHAVDAITGRALRIHHAGLAIGQLASADPVTRAGITLVVRILAEENRTTGAIGTLAFQGPGTGFTRAHAGGIAAIPVDTEAARTSRRNRTGLAVDALAIANAVACARIAFVVWIGVGRNVRTRPDTSRIGTRNTRS
jgi:hypothetical protein